MPEAGTSGLRSETAMRGAAARIVEIGGQFDTQHLGEPQLASSNLRQGTAIGNSLRERAASKVPRHACKRKPQSSFLTEVKDAGMVELSGSGVATVQSSPSQGTGSGSMGGGATSTPHGEKMQSLLHDGKVGRSDSWSNWKYKS